MDGGMEARGARLMATGQKGSAECVIGVNRDNIGMSKCAISLISQQRTPNGDPKPV